MFIAITALAQVSASFSGRVTDPQGATVSGANVIAKNVETGETRSTFTDDAGRFWLPSLAVGEYELHAMKQGFQERVRSGIHLSVAQSATVDMELRIGQVAGQVKVIADTPVVSVTSADISGLVGERQVKDLPLNGRSYDELMTLNPGVVNFTWEKTGGIGISNSTTGNMFSVQGNRPQQNLFLLNGVEFSGAAENNMQPGGTSQQLLGVDAVREFNLLRDTYGAQYGKHPGGQVTILTQSGTNQWHGSVFEYLRNSALDAPNFFDQGDTAPPFWRDQFGGALGGPIQKDKTFVFANYEGFRQNLHQTSLTFVPDASARNGTFLPLGSGCPLSQQAACAAEVSSLLNLWPVANGPDNPAAGIAQYFSSPLQTIREDFGTARVDHIFSAKDSAMAAYTNDDSGSVTATPFDPFSTDIVALREQVFSLEETHIFSPTVVNTGRIGFSRAGYFFTGEPTPGTPAASVPGFVGNLPVGAVVVGGSQASNPQSQVGLAGSNNGSNLHIARNIFTYSDQIVMTHGRHQFTGGVWFQRLQSNEEIALSQFGQLTFSGVPGFLAGVGSFLYDPTPTPVSWRSLFGAWYLEDVIRLRPNLSLTLGFRDELSTGWNEAYGKASNYTYPNGVISSQPNIGTALFTVNHAKGLMQPRLGLAWGPLSKTVVRAGFGMYNDLQDALGYRADQNAPFNPTYTIASGSIANLHLPINPSAPPAAGAMLVPGGVQPDMQTPTVISYSLRVERELSPNTSLSVGYVGSHGYHELIGVDANSPMPVVCPASPCPAIFPNAAVWGALAGTPVPAGTFFVAPGTKKPNPAMANTWTWFSEGNSSYNALQVDLKRRFNHGLAIRGVYTWSKSLDNGDSLNATAAANAVALLSNPYVPRADWGLATYDVRNLGVVTATYELPFGEGRKYLSSEGMLRQVAGGWTLNSIVTAQSGFPFTPQLSYNPSNNGDTRNPVRAFLNPAFTGPVVLGNPNQWFNPNAFIAPPNNSGFFGNVGRDAYTGPGLATWDFSVLKDTHIYERLNLQFRAEIFNLLDRSNFNTPNLITHVLLPGPTPGSTSTTPVASPAAGVITSTSTWARQVQFGLKFLW